MNVRSLISMFVFLAISSAASAQCKEFIWPEDKKKAEESVAVWGDALKSGDIKHLRAATPAIQWMVANAPKWNTKVYIDGVTIYDKVADAETDPARKKAYVDTLLNLFDARVKNCGDEVNVLNRKAYASYKYNIKEKTQLAALLALYDKVYEISGNNVTDANLVAYMTTVKANRVYLKALTDDDIISRYDKIIAVADAKIANAKNPEDATKIRGYKDAVDALLIGMVKVDCDFVKKNLQPKFKQNQNDLALAKKIFKFMLEGKCTDDPLWLEAGEVVYRMSPEKDFGLLKALGATHMSNGNTEKASTLFNEAMKLNISAADKSDIQIFLGAIEAKGKNYAEARKLFLEAAAGNPSNKEPYEKIGDLYYNSFDDCAKRANMAEDRLVYLAAYEMYQKAGNAAGMSRAKAQFPSKEDIFLLNWQAGSTQRVGCWIQESVVLKTRD